MWAWLNVNASAIQAISAVVGVVATIVLVCITARYVQITNTLATAQAKALSNRRQELVATVEFLVSALDLLPRSNDPLANHPLALRHALKWDRVDFNHVRALASEVSLRAAQCVSDAESRMKAFAQRGNSNQGVPARDDYEWGPAPFAKPWDETIQEARASLAQILREISVVAGDDNKNTFRT